MVILMLQRDVVEEIVDGEIDGEMILERMMLVILMERCYCKD